MTLFLSAFLLSWLFHGLGITVGYHRLLSHRAFKAPKFIEYFFVLGGYLCFEGSPISWVTTHRIHHRYTDMEGDPHSPLDGLWYSFLGWLTKPNFKITRKDFETTCPDLFRDPVYRILHRDDKKAQVRLCFSICVAFRAVIWFFFGPIAVLANVLGALTPFIGAFLVNSICHYDKCGYRNFQTPDFSRNVWWVAILSLGEGWHNNHHAVPQSARHGLSIKEFDVSWYAIRLLQLVGLATDIKKPRLSVAWTGPDVRLRDRLVASTARQAETADVPADAVL